MSLQEITGDLNLGQDIALSFILNGQTIPADSVGLVMKFNAKLNVTKIKAKPVSHKSRPRIRHTKNGYTGSIRIGRINGSVNDLISKLSGDTDANDNMPRWDLPVTIRNRDGSTNDYLFKNCNLGDADFGDYEADKYVELEIPFECESMKPVTAPTL